MDDCLLDGDIFPKYFTLSHNYPNPFNPITSIDFTIPKGDYISMNVLDIKGQTINNIIETLNKLSCFNNEKKIIKKKPIMIKNKCLKKK